MTSDDLENYRNTFKARAKSKLKRWYIEGHSASALNEIANPFRKEAKIIFSEDDIDEHLQYVESLVVAGERAVEASPVNPDDPDTLFTRDPDDYSEDLKRDGERFEHELDDLDGQIRGDNE